MVDLKGFRKANKLKQYELAKVLGISRSFLAQIECGSSKLPEAHLQTLLASKDYDTSMLLVDSPSTNISAKASSNSTAQVCIGSSESIDLAILRAENDMLRHQIEELRAEKDKYWEMIQKLMK